MESLLAPFLTFLLLYKYVALFLIAVVASIALPIPESFTLAAAGGFASQGYLNIAAILGVALAGNVAGDAIAFLLARRYGEDVLKKIGFGKMLRSRQYHKLKEYVLDFPQSIIFFSRLLTETGPPANILVGLSGVAPGTFFLFTILGETAYVLLYGYTGYLFGAEWQTSAGSLSKGALVSLPIGIGIGMLQVVFFKHNRKRKPRVSEADRR
jgi:membrane-associated protein